MIGDGQDLVFSGSSELVKNAPVIAIIGAVLFFVVAHPFLFGFVDSIIEKVIDDISFTATDRGGETVVIDKNYVTKNLGELVKDTDLSKFIL